MECVILYRTHGGKVCAVMDDGDELAVYPTKEAAIEDSESRKLFKAVPYQIVELTEL